MNAAIPTSSAATTPIPVTHQKRRSARGGSGPRMTSSRKPSPPRSRARARNSARRTRCSERVGPPAPAPTEAYGAGGPTRSEHLVRWAYFLALALLLGGLGFRLL